MSLNAVVQEALRPPQAPPERPWKVTVALDGTRKVWEPEGPPTVDQEESES